MGSAAQAAGRSAESAVGDALRAATDALAAAGVDSPRLDAELMLEAASGRDRALLIAEPGAPIAPGAAREFAAMVRRRLRREPLAYILGSKGFRRIELAVDRRALIPRPETELLVEVALEVAPASVLDVGTGSGAVALAIAAEMPGCSVTATDTSAAALELARHNAERLGLAHRVEFLEASVPATEFELTVANLPYVAEGDRAELQPEIARWEPPGALFGGSDGLEAIRAAIPCLRSPVAALEVGAGQAPAVSRLLLEAGFAEVGARPDLAGIERVVIGRR